MEHPKEYPTTRVTFDPKTGKILSEVKVKEREEDAKEKLGPNWRTILAGFGDQ
jgi:hypothetical protein